MRCLFLLIKGFKHRSLTPESRGDEHKACGQARPYDRYAVSESLFTMNVVGVMLHKKYVDTYMSMSFNIMF